MTKKTSTKNLVSLTRPHQDLLNGMISTLSYLEALAFREGVTVAFAGLRLAQIAVEMEADGQADIAEYRQRVSKALEELD